MQFILVSKVQFLLMLNHTGICGLYLEQICFKRAPKLACLLRTAAHQRRRHHGGGQWCAQRGGSE
jgi:hypothetical protein